MIAAFLGLLLPLAASQTAQPQQPPPAPPPEYKEAVDVVGVTPIHGLGVPRLMIPANVQVLSSDVFRGDPGMSVGATLASRLASVNLSDAQVNPFQPDIQFRGFGVSPLLGLPQGLAVYQDGVRSNEPFGDTVNWDLIPANAIASVNLMPGSSPLFGLNALGGALSIQTKTGFSHPGHAVAVSGGSFGRAWVDFESGAHSERLSYFVAGQMLREDGWRDFSPSRTRRVFGNLEWQEGVSMLGGSISVGSNRLIGNGPAPVQLLDQDRSAIFTHPDETKNDVALLTARGSRVFGRDVSLHGVGFYRPGTVHTFNGDDTTYDECESRAFRERLCADDGEGPPVVDQDGRLVPVDDDDPFTATNNTSSTRTRGWGGSAQLTVARALGGRTNQFIAGASFDRAGSRYEADTEIARLTDSRGTEGTGIFDATAAVRLETTATHTGFYLADFFNVGKDVTISGSARFTHSVIDLRDELGDDLTGEHRFNRLNPSAGLTWQFRPELAAYGSYSTASRVPTPSELGCADPEDPCRLPNAFVADPPLEQVVAHTLEGGLRGRKARMSWSASWFRTINHDDIIFISSGALTNEGHFENVGNTARKGLELHVSGITAARVQWDASYTYLRGTFQTPLVLSSPNHPDEIEGEIAVEAGDSLPGVPRHNLKLNVMATAGSVAVGGDVLYTSSQFLRGDEANLLTPIDGRTVVNLNGSYRVRDWLRVSAQAVNLFNSKSSTFGLLGEADDVLGDDFDDPRFLSPLGPRAAWIGIEFVFR